MTTAMYELSTGWQTRPLGDLGRVVRGGSPRPAGDPRYFNGSFIPWLTVASLTAIPASQIRVSETAGCLTEEGAKRSRTLLPNTLVLANSGATLGVAKILDLQCCANDGIAALIDQHAGNREFICQYLNTRTEYLRDVVAPGNGQPNLNTSLIKDIEVPFPPVPEQEAIAEVLADGDDLITKLVRIIAKKRDVRQGMMQELLTGRSRLPGFTGEWKLLPVADNSHLRARIGWQGLTTGEYLTSGEYRLVGGTDFKNGHVNWESTAFVDQWRFDQDKNIQLVDGDVLITKDGTIGKVAIVDSMPGPSTLNSGVFVLRPKRDAYDSGFIFWMLRSRVFEEFVAGLSAGSTITHLYQRDLVTLELLVPPMLEEQAAISRILTDADVEIVALERRLESARAVKVGMMQELLTGRTRLPVTEEV
ncbi:restriction endonuclease subunit S [Arthrobacter sp. KN11-1C]|uniref:restriction endonuclease subunit S n=1 Tax=Arthrobacter sp. KN11-1C TaxID=3445774 RepID=UPI003F9FAE50